MGVPVRSDYLKLHFIVLLWGFTAILGKLIELPALEVVFFRTWIASFVLMVVLRGEWRVPRRDAIKFVATGSLIGLHWVLFFLAVKKANVSVCMVAMATTSLWTALLQPLLLRGYRLKSIDVAFAMIVLAAVAFIFYSELQYSDGFLLGIASACVAALFSIINGTFAVRFHHHVITLYEMIGAALFCTACLPLSSVINANGVGINLRPSLSDTGWLLTLAVVCTVYAYSEYVELLKRMSVFTVNFANNLEPVYGIALGAILLSEYRFVGFQFYVGAAIIVTTVACYTAMTRRLGKKTPTPSACH